MDEHRFVIALTFEQLNSRRARHLRAMVMWEPALLNLPDEMPRVDFEEHKTRYRTLQAISRLYRKHPERFGVVKVWRPKRDFTAESRHHCRRGGNCAAVTRVRGIICYSRRTDRRWIRKVEQERGNCEADSTADVHGSRQPSAAPNDTHTSTFSAAMNASCGMSTFPYWRIFFLPSFCFSRSLRLRVTSPP